MTTTLPPINTKSSKKFNYKNLTLDDSQSQFDIKHLVSAQAINKYYKTNNIHDILGKDLDFYPKGLELKQDIQVVNETSRNLHSLKKSYDFLRQKSHKLEQEINSMKGEIQYIKVYKEEKSGDTQKKQGKQQNFLEQFSEMHQKLQNEENKRQTYLHMIDRMKKDFIIFQKRIYELQQNLDIVQNVEKAAQEKQQKIDQVEFKANNALSEIIHCIEEDHKDREKHINDFKTEMDQKKEFDKQKDERFQRQIEIAELAASEVRDRNLKKWRKLLTVHILLKTFLQEKMEREMKKYAIVEKSFYQIKADTGITDADEIVTKFLNREQTQSHLLASVSENEKKISEIKLKNKQLTEQLIKLKYQTIPSDKPQKKEEKNSDEILKIQEFHRQTFEKTQNIQFVHAKVHSWMIRNLIKLERCFDKEKSIEAYYKEFSKQNLLNVLQQIIAILKLKLLPIGAKDLRKSYMESKKTNGITMQEFQKRNLRIKISPKENENQFKDLNLFENSDNYSPILIMKENAINQTEENKTLSDQEDTGIFVFERDFFRQDRPLLQPQLQLQPQSHLQPPLFYLGSFQDENSHLKVLRDGMKSKGKKNGKKMLTIV